MINKKSIQAVKNSNFNSFFKKPLYSSYCFSNITSLIEYCLGANTNLRLPKDVLGNLPHKYQKVILFFIDGFGWRFFEKFANHPFLKKAAKFAVVSKITSQFPSITDAHVTKIHTNLTVGESGIYGFYYEPTLDRIIAPLLFSFAGDKKRDTLKKAKIKPEQIYPPKTFYQKLKKAGIKSYIFQHQEYTPSTYSDIVFRGAKVAGYKTLPEAIINLFETISSEKNKAYYFLYFDKIDSLSHQYGPTSLQVEAEIESFLSAMERIFLKKFFSLPKDTLFLLTADHGQVEVNPKTTIYINIKFPQIKKWIKKNKKGKLLAPAGSCRAMFLYIKEEYLNEAKQFLQEKLEGKAEVYLVKDLINQGFFGEKISKEFLSRVGNLVILPYKGESVWWYQKGRFEQKYYGDHGGLIEDEVCVPLLAFYS